VSMESIQAKRSHLARRLSWALAALMAAQAALGILVPSIYRDVLWIRTAWLGTDVVTLFVVVPLLVWGLLASGRGSARGELLWYGALGYGVYNNAYYLLGASLNRVFPLYAVLTVGCGWTLLIALTGADVPAIAARFGARTLVRAVAAYMTFTGVGLAVAWLGQWAAFAFAGVTPSIGEGPFRLVASMDLSLIVPVMLVGAVMLWRRMPWGFVVAAIANTLGAAYTLGLTAASAFGAARGIAGSAAQMPVWGVWTLVGVAATAALLWRVTPSPTE
jgi:hypothetical protein